MSLFVLFVLLFVVVVWKDIRSIIIRTGAEGLSFLLRRQITNGTRSTVKMLPGFVLLCPGPVPDLLGWAYPEQLGLSSTACGLVLGNSIRPCTNGVSLLHRIASVAPLSKPQTCTNSGPIHQAPHGARGLTVLDDKLDGLITPSASI